MPIQIFHVNAERPEPFVTLPSIFSFFQNFHLTFAQIFSLFHYSTLYSHFSARQSFFNYILKALKMLQVRRPHRQTRYQIAPRSIWLILANLVIFSDKFCVTIAKNIWSGIPRSAGCTILKFVLNAEISRRFLDGCIFPVIVVA